MVKKEKCRKEFQGNECINEAGKEADNNQDNVIKGQKGINGSQLLGRNVEQKRNIAENNETTEKTRLKAKIATRSNIKR